VIRNGEQVEDLEDMLLEFGKALTSPPSAVDLYTLLEPMVSCQKLTITLKINVECPQSLMKALPTKEFLRRSDMDVRVTAPSCISEVTRIQYWSLHMMMTL